MPLTALATAVVTVPLTAALTWWWTRPPAPAASPSSERTAPAAASAPLARVIPAPALGRSPAPWATGADRVAAADLDGDGVSEIALAGASLRVVRADGAAVGEFPAAGGIYVLEGIGASIFAGWGRTKAVPDGRASFTRYGFDGAKLTSEVVVEPKTERAQTVAATRAGSDLLLAWFRDKYTVTAQRASRSPAGWSLAPWTEARTAPTWLVADVDGDGADDLVYGRTYGDAPGSDGDAWLVRSDGSRVAIPTTRGVRAGCLADTDGDGRPEVVLADGWDRDYGHKARAELRVVTWREGAVASEVIDQPAGDNDVSRVIAADVDGDGRDEILAVTNTRLRVVERDGDGWVAWDAARGVADAAVVADGGRLAILVVSAEPVILAVGGQ